MRTIVRFRSATRTYALPVENVAEVRSAGDLTPLPAPRAGVAGVVPRAGGALTVLSALGESGSHVIVIEQDRDAFGLLVDEVTEVTRVEDDVIGPPPAGQGGTAVSGVMHDGDDLVLVLDPIALHRTLSS